MADSIMTPEGRLINGSLFEKDVYKDDKGREATPSYKIEIAFDDNDDLADLEEAIIAAAVETWGDKAEAMYDSGEISGPLLVGDDLAKARQERGKEGDAYAGKIVARAHTIFNKHGENAPGGVYVAGSDGLELPFDKRGTIYNGSYGIAVVTPETYEISGKKGVTLYLSGYQFSRDGEPLRGNSVAGMFKPLAKPSEASEGQGRRRRRG